jgi:hypothetical protein
MLFKLMIFAGLLLASLGHAADITGRKLTVINIGGGSNNDPTKLPLLGGTMVGTINMASPSIVVTTSTLVGIKVSTPGMSVSLRQDEAAGLFGVFLTSGANTAFFGPSLLDNRTLLESSDNIIIDQTNDPVDRANILFTGTKSSLYDSTIYQFRSPPGALNGTNLLFSSSTTISSMGNNTGNIQWKPGGIEIDGGVNLFGEVSLIDHQAQLKLNGGVSPGRFTVFTSSAMINGQGISIISGGSTNITITSGGAVDLRASGSVLPPSGIPHLKALCINAINQLSACTTVVDIAGGCTCP